MSQQIKIRCDGCEYYCHPKMIPLEVLKKLIQSNPRITNEIYHLETVVVVCPEGQAVIYAKIG